MKTENGPLFAALAAILISAGMISTASAQSQPGSDPAPVSKPSDWSKLMPNSNPMEAPAPTISLPNSKFTKAPVAPQSVSDRVTTNVREALAYAQKDDWDRALESIDKAIALDPNVDFLYSFRAKVFKNLGRNNESVKDLMKYKELQAKSNSDAVDRYHKQQVKQAGMPDLRDRVRSFLGN
jgi:tetratricopeptide (TPR) repeat protein